MIRRITLLLFLTFAAVEATAQLMPQPAGADSIRNAFFPVVGYSSDDGLFAGAVYNRYDYSGQRTPFHTYLQTMGVISTKGFVKIEGLYEQTDAFNSGLRSRTYLFLHRRTYDTFFGVGNNTGYSEQLWEDEYYFFRSVSFGLNVELRKTLYFKRGSYFDVLGGLGTEYFIPYQRQTNSSFAQLNPNGQDGGFVHYLESGFIWENRDSEFDPSSGNRARLNIRFSPAFLSRYALTRLSLDLRQYWYVFDFLKIANRLNMKQAAGDVPFWELPALGDDYSLRGYPLHRFRGSSSVAYNLELRSWMFTFPEYELKLGVHVFTDVGRVFTEQDRFNDLFSGYKQTFGFGGAMSMFSPDFMLRGEMGFSDETSRIYIGVGYSF